VRLNGVATYIGAVGLSVAAAVLVVLIVRYHTYDLANELLLFFCRGYSSRFYFFCFVDTSWGTQRMLMEPSNI
jgi:hypothetical protein